MRYRFFTIPVLAADAAAADLNSFLAAHRVLGVERHLIPDGANSVWTVCVTFDDPGVAHPAPAVVSRNPPVDYREKLTEPEFAVYSRLRALRKATYEAAGIPSYAVFTNEQMARMITGRMTALARLREIPGIGESRITKYGDAFLQIIRDAHLPEPAAPPEPAADET